MDHLKMLEKEIREDWFKDHVATIKHEGSTTIIEWKKPGTSFYWVRYVLVDSVVFITGDLGDAIYRLTEKASIESLKNYELGYFMRKLSCCEHSRWDFDSEKAEKEIIAWYVERSYDVSEEKKEELKDIKDRLLSGLSDYSSVEGMNHIVWSIYEDTGDIFDSEDADQVSDFGKILPGSFIAFLTGLKMAAEQLLEKKK